MLWAFMIFLAIIIKSEALEDGNSKKSQNENPRGRCTTTSIQFKNAEIELIYDVKKTTQNNTQSPKYDNEVNNNIDTNEESICDRLARRNDIKELRVKFNIKPKTKNIDEDKSINKKRIQNKYREEKKGRDSNENILRNKKNGDKIVRGDNVNSSDANIESKYASLIENELPDDIDKQSSPGREKKVYIVNKHVDIIKTNDHDLKNDNISGKKGNKAKIIKTDAALGLDDNDSSKIIPEAGVEENNTPKSILLDRVSNEDHEKSGENYSHIKTERINKKIPPRPHRQYTIDPSSEDTKQAKIKTNKHTNSFSAHKLYTNRKQPHRKEVKHKIKVGGEYVPYDIGDGRSKESSLKRDKYKKSDVANDYDGRLHQRMVGVKEKETQNRPIENTDIISNKEPGAVVKQSQEITNTKEVIEFALQEQLLAHPEKFKNVLGNGNKRKKYKIKLLSDSSEEVRNNGFTVTKNVLEDVQYSDNAASDDEIVPNTRRELSVHKRTKEDNHKTIQYNTRKNKIKAHEDTKEKKYNFKTARKTAEVKKYINPSKASKFRVKRHKNNLNADTILSRDDKHKLNVKKFLQSERLIEMLADQLVKESLKNEAKMDKNEVFEIMI